MAIRFTKAARKHRLGRARVVAVMSHAAMYPVRTNQGNAACLYVGQDPRGFTVEVIAVALDNGDLLVIHASPVYEGN